MIININAARHAATFAADTTAAGQRAHNTHSFETLAVVIGVNADLRNTLAESSGTDFYPCAFAEAAAQALNENPDASLDELLAAGQFESDRLANA